MPTANPAPNKTIGLFYGSSTCYTEIAAEKIRDFFNNNDSLNVQVTLQNVAEISPSQMSAFDLLILGIPTWDYGELQEDWEAVWLEIDDVDLTNKKVAIYGLGDQIGYPEWFQDAVGYLYEKVLDCGGEVCGYWPAKGYKFERSLALTENEEHFVGLALDDESEFELSEQRISDWCKQLSEEFGLSSPEE